MAIGNSKQSKAFSKTAQETTYLVIELISLKRKSHRIDVNIRLIYKILVKMLGQRCSMRG